MAIRYNEICKNRQLNQVVLMGSHDAAIASGGSNAKTQTQDIYGQARDGARFFDLRVAAFRTSTLGGKVELRSYHDATKVSSPTLRLGDRMKVVDLGDQKRDNVKVHTNMLGVSGFGLRDMLVDAKRFLQQYDKEFLIFKFDKSENWPLIYEVCYNELVAQGFMFQAPSAAGGARNLNTKQLRDLRGKLLILFPASAFTEIPGKTADTLHGEGFLKWKNLYSKSSNAAAGYDDDYEGLQYYGKGGVSAGASGDTGKIDRNRNVQAQLMNGQGAFATAKTGWKGMIGQKNKGFHASAPGKAIGLMYWTTTGPSTSGILKRNGKMWTDVVRGEMIQIGLQMADPTVAVMGPGGAGVALKPFMPNIIMVDFVDRMKGNTIKDMNFNSGAVIAQQLVGMDA